MLFAAIPLLAALAAYVCAAMVAVMHHRRYRRAVAIRKPAANAVAGRGPRS